MQEGSQPGSHGVTGQACRQAGRQADTTQGVSQEGKISCILHELRNKATEESGRTVSP